MPTSLSWIESAKRDRWTLDEQWSVRRRGGKWFAYWDSHRFKSGFPSAEKANAYAERLIADEKEGSAR